MAWKARLDRPIVPAGDKIYATFVFFDDANEAGTAHSEDFVFSPAWTNAQMQEAVQSRGQAIRAARTRATALAAAFPAVTTVISIP